MLLEMALVNLRMALALRELDRICSISSGGGEPEEGVEGDGDPDSTGEFMKLFVVVTSWPVLSGGAPCLTL